MPLGALPIFSAPLGIPMPESSVLLLCLSLITFCVIAIAVDMHLTSRVVRRMIHSMSRQLPEWGLAASEIRRTLQQSRKTVERAHEAARQVGAVVKGACETADETLAQVRFVEGKARQLLKQYLGNGNGAREEPRRRIRRRK